MTYLTQKQLAAISGISRETLRHWSKTGVLRAEKRLKGRVAESVYTRVQAIGAMSLAELRKRGVSWDRLRGAAATLPLVVSESGWLVFDGDRILAGAKAEEVVALIEQSNSLVRLMSVSRLAERLPR